VLIHQTDTYFVVRNGRLKLREINGAAAQLIWYQRADQQAAKCSEYTLVDVPDSAALKFALSGALGVLRVVEKRREVYFYDNVRIHLDAVVGLGEFLEFEAVLSDDLDSAAGHSHVRWLLEQFSIEPAELLPGSYSDLSPSELPN
jgi:predicted adenylyl cyclase CyaB